MAKRPSTPSELRDAVERTVQATLGSAERQRDRTQGAIDDLAGTVDNLRRGAGARPARAGAARSRIAGPPPTRTCASCSAELRAIGRRLDAIEERLPAKRTPAKRAPAKRTAAKRTPKRSS